MKTTKQLFLIFGFLCMQMAFAQNQNLFTNTGGTGSQRNSGFGFNALSATSLSPAYSQDNAALGFNALGAYTGSLSMSGKNVAVGSRALELLQFGFSNVACGYMALSSTTSTYNTVAMGSNALQSLTSGSLNTAVGAGALNLTTTGKSNTAVGVGALRNNVSGDNNVALGQEALENNNSIGKSNVAIGFQALRMGAGDSNIAIGYQALTNVYNGIPSFTGNANIAIGTSSGLSLTSGASNTFVGTASGYGIATGSNNTFIGKVMPNSDLNGTIILADGAGSQRFHIANNGFAGINLGNNNAPTETLDVGGTLKVRSMAVSTTNPYFLSADASGKVFRQQINAAAGAATNLALSATPNTMILTNPLTPGNSVLVPNLYTTDGALAADRTVDMANNKLFFNTQFNGAIYIGNQFAGFNTTSFPVTTGDYKLYVDGGILTEKVKVAVPGTMNWADYVFADNYKLMPLHEVEAFVKENKHLPGIESAEALTKNGLDLGDMQAKQMEKIEELTLHLIEQNKMLEKQHKEIEMLKSQMNELLKK